MKVTKRQMVSALRDWQRVLRESYGVPRGKKWTVPPNIKDEINVLECIIKLVKTVPPK